jgi:4-hydroxy-tetrahydrodipicolinate synthase
MLALRGSFVALVTPFRAAAGRRSSGGRVDESALRKLVRWQLAEGTDGLVPCGTTGEGATLSSEEAQLATRICAEESAAFAKKSGTARVPVITGCGSNSTAHTIENVQRAKEAGADAALVVVPYYNKPTQEGLFRHFEAVAREGGLPVVLYNIPSRSSVDMSAETVARLSRVKGIVGIKEASGNIARISEIREKCTPDFALFAGDDMFTLPTLALGGHGVISVVGNIAPADLAGLVDAFAAGRLAQAQSAQQRFSPLVRALFCETNPAPVKYALFKMGRIANELRLPLVPVSQDAAAKMDAAMKSYGELR